MLAIRINSRLILLPTSTRTVFDAVKHRFAWEEHSLLARPHYCYKEGQAAPVASCRICRIEVELGAAAAKPVPACARPVQPGMQLWTDTVRVRKVREAVMEFLLRNHPLDCPICDQAGECDLQNQSKEYGTDRSRLTVPKRGVQDKSLGYHIRRVITRCIHCTRCVRFHRQLGVLGRGRQAEIGTYTQTTLEGTGIGNRVERCPVGARTSFENAYLARPWEIQTVTTLDWVGGQDLVSRRSLGKRRIDAKPLPGRTLPDAVRFSLDTLRLGRLVHTQSNLAEAQPASRYAVQHGSVHVQRHPVVHPLSSILSAFLAQSTVRIGTTTDVLLQDVLADRLISRCAVKSSVRLDSHVVPTRGTQRYRPLSLGHEVSIYSLRQGRVYRSRGGTVAWTEAPAPLSPSSVFPR